MPLSTIVIISPRKGYEERCRELASRLSNTVKNSEPDTLSYCLFTGGTEDEQESDFCIYIEYE